MRCLIVAPLPTVPATQGNAAGIATKARLLQQAGYQVHLLISTLEGVSADQLMRMRQQWDIVDVVPFSGKKIASFGTEYGLDDWYDPRVSEAIARLQERWYFDLALVNYVWMSAAFNGLDARTLKVLDTHDRFGGRKNTLEASGLMPTWYYTTAREEARGFDRADLILAVQEREAIAFRQITPKPVFTVGHIVPPKFVPARRSRRARLRIGYIGSSNLTNRRSVAELIRAFEKRRGMQANVQLVVAGPISEFVPPHPWIQLVGVIPDPHMLYQRVDCVVNPDVGGTGVKVKSVEALSSGRAVVSTASGMEGLEASSPFHLCRDADDVVEALTSLRTDEVLERVEIESRMLFLSYLNKQLISFAKILSGKAA